MINTKPIVYIDLDDTLSQYTKLFNQRLKTHPDIAYPQSQYGFYTDLELMPGAIEGIQQLQQLGFEVYILTAPSIYNPMSYTEKRMWVEKNLGFELVEKLIICNNKGLLKGDILIDDQATGRGQGNFAGKLIMFGRKPFESWNDITRYIARLI